MSKSCKIVIGIVLISMGIFVVILFHAKSEVERIHIIKSLATEVQTLQAEIAELEDVVHYGNQVTYEVYDILNRIAGSEKGGIAR